MRVISMGKNGFRHSQSSTTSVVKHRDPLAIVGIGCRFPGGANDPESYWRLLLEGRDAIREVPSDRWNAEAFYDADPSTPGRTISRWGGFIEAIDEFDAGFFGISPREAAYMDPQQRLLLETSVEALEDAGQPFDAVAGTETGVFIGLSGYDYAIIQHGIADRRNISPHSNTGAALSISANRLSYFFDLRGTSFIVDTACSSALVAVHLACQSIWRGEIASALAGGVNVLIKPEPFIGFSRMSMLSADGHCKPFDASADGFVRGEGVGIVLIKPLARALHDGDEPYAVILATASNQDGRTNSMTVPSQKAQERLLRETCREAGVTPSQIGYFEAHGTGTLVGDPIEARALGSVLGTGRSRNRPCFIGSSKTNIGHLEPAAGIAGLIKAALCLKHKTVPPNVNFRKLNPEIPMDDLGLRVPTQLEPWPQLDGLRLAGVNSFGFGGTNAQALLQEAPPTHRRKAERGTDDRPQLVPLSARSRAALVAMADSYLRFLDERKPALADVSHSASLRRTHHDHRLAVVAHSVPELAENLRSFLAERPVPSVVSGRLSGKQDRRIVFVCSGQGPQWWRMGRELLEGEPVFRAVIEQCDELIRARGNWSLLEELKRDEERSRIEQTAIAQPAIFALQVALARLWNSWGIAPAAVIGHSVGEVAAAHLAGALSLEDAVHVIFHRGRCMDFASAHGKMLAVGLGVEEAKGLLKGREDRISLAAMNSPRSQTLSGDGDALEELAASLEAEGIFHRFLRVSYAFHSPLMDPTRDPLLEALSAIAPGELSLPMYSTVTGSPLKGPELRGEYWWQNVRESVRFAPAVSSLIEEGYEVFVELSPHPVLSGSVLECAGTRSESLTVVPSLRRNEEERFTMLQSLASLFAVGSRVDWNGVCADSDGAFVRLPKYPWQRQRYWTESETSREARLAKTHPLLGRRTSSAQPRWEGFLDLKELRYLRDHRVQGQPVYPATAYIEMAFAAAEQIFGAVPSALEELELSRACFLSEEEGTLIHLTANPAESSIRIHTRRADRADWVEHARAYMQKLEAGDTPSPADLESLRRRCPVEMPREECYSRLQEMGLDYGPAFRSLERVWLRDNEVLARIEARPESREGAGAYLIHPAVLDACLQSMLLGHAYDTGRKELHLPVEVHKARLYGRVPTSIWTHVRQRGSDGRDIIADLRILDDAGRTLLVIEGARGRRVDQGREMDRLRELVYEYEWRPSTVASSSAVGTETPGFPSTQTLAEATRAGAAEVEEKLGLDRRSQDFQRETEPLCTAFIGSAFEALGVTLKAQERFTTDELMRRLGVPADGGLALRHCLELLRQDGVLRETDSTWEVVRLLGSEDPREMWRRDLDRHPGFYAELMLVARYGDSLPKLLRGETSPSRLLSGELGPLTDQLYQDSPSVRAQTVLAERFLETLFESFREGKTLRILELGGLRGIVASQVLPKLPAHGARYVVGSGSEQALAKAKEKLRDCPVADFLRIDIEKELESQEVAPRSFDVVLDYYGLLGVGDPIRALANVNRLLDSGGMLLLVEGTGRPRWMDFVFGAAEGEESTRDWPALLQQSGFRDVVEALGRKRNVASYISRAPECAAAQASSPVQAEVPVEARKLWVVLCDRAGLGERLVGELKQRGHDCVAVLTGEPFESVGAGQYRIAPGRAEDFERLIESLGSRPPNGVVHLWNGDASDSEEGMKEAFSLGSLSMVYLTQALSRAAFQESPRLWMVTRGAESLTRESEAASVAQTPAWGLNRVVMNEHPDLRATSVDLPRSPSVEDIRALADLLLSDTREDEIALRGGQPFVHRYVRSADVESRPSKKISVGKQNFRLETSPRNVIDGLILRAAERRSPRPGEIEIQVAAAGLNFSDVMKALGLYPGLGDGPVPLGIECSGTVTSVGEGVSNLRPGDHVMAVAPFSFGGFVTTAAHLAVRKPSRLSFEEAATIPVAFLTADYALNYMGRLGKGERALIHSATGGVGLAALQLVKRAGAEVFATAGTAEKRELLRFLGIEHIMDSRSLGFAEETLERTAGEGVDVVLNSLAGDAIRKGISVLADDGRFLEIGKRDIYGDSRIGLKPFRKNLSFMAIDLDREFRKRPGLIHSLFESLGDRFENEELFPLPYRLFSISDAAGAFRYMAQAKHVGKVVISLQEREVSVAPPSERSLRFPAEATYLITGGLGGFGLKAAEWLVASGARHLVLMGRRGLQAPEAERAVQSLRRAGAEVVVAQMDVTDREKLRSLLANIDRSMPPLRGVIHAAMVLKDGLIRSLDEDRLRAVWGPKVEGAWNLHQLTLEKPLDFFVLCSSMSAVLGAGGQGNYAAANAFLDGLAYYRRARGLPGLSVSWGFLGEVGVAVRQEDLARRFVAAGIESLSPAEALTLLGRFLRDERVQVGAMRLDWTRWRSATGGASGSPRFQELLREAESGGETGEGRADTLRGALIAADREKRPEMLRSILIKQLTSVLGASADNLDAEKPLSDLGLDSLMAVELRNWIERELGVGLAAVELLRGPSLVELSDLLVNQLAEAETPTSNGAPLPELVNLKEPVRSPEAKELLEEVDEMTDEEVDVLLNEIARKRQGV
jgi:acyl transferase domain-containing protein/aryl carrier-like protein